MNSPSAFALLKEIVHKYDNALKIICANKLTTHKQEIFNTLIIRDQLFNFLSNEALLNEDKVSVDLLNIDEQVEALDAILRDNQNLIAESISLDKWRSRLNPSKQQWWWYFEAPKKPNKWTRFDWILDAFTMVFLALIASYIFNIIKALSVGDLTIASIFSAIAQLGGLAVISQGALTEKGRIKARQLLTSISIPASFQSKIMLITTLTLFGLSYHVNNILDNYFESSGNAYYTEGDLAAAENEYLRAIQINPDNPNFNTSLGKIYESMGEVDKAIEQYRTNAQNGHSEALNNLGRTLINHSNPITGVKTVPIAEAFLMLGLQRAKLNSAKYAPNDPAYINILYQLYRNIGWATLKQKKYHKAEHFLLEAIRLDEIIDTGQTGGGMAYCFLADLYSKQGKLNKARTLWLNCFKYARPETILEYKWFIESGNDDLALCVDTSRVVSGIKNYTTLAKEALQCKKELHLNSLDVKENSALDKHGIAVIETKT